MSKINSRSKGKRGEYGVRDMFIAHGFPARRGQQFAGGKDSPDVIIPDLQEFLHVECKFVEKLDLNAAVGQAERDAGGKWPVVFHKKKNKEWLVTMSTEAFFEWVTKIHDEQQKEIGNKNHTDAQEQEIDSCECKNPSG